MDQSTAGHATRAIRHRLLWIARQQIRRACHPIKNYRTSACRGCALRARCTRNKDGRKITRWVDEHLLEAMEAHLRRAPEVFAQRKVLSEHPFGTMKRGMDQGYFLLKGLRKVRGEFSLTVLAYNLKRVLNLVGVPRLLEALA